MSKSACFLLTKYSPKNLIQVDGERGPPNYSYFAQGTAFFKRLPPISSDFLRRPIVNLETLHG